jgi:hypothetical protein
MAEIIVGPFPSRDQAERCSEAVRRHGKGWWLTNVIAPDTTTSAWQIRATSTRFNTEGDVKQFAERLSKKGPCRGKVKVRDEISTEGT